MNRAKVSQRSKEAPENQKKEGRKMDNVIDNEDGTRTLMAGKTLLAICTLIQAQPGITLPELVAEVAKDPSLECKPSTVGHHVERLHLRMAIRKLPVKAEGAPTKGRSSLGIHWTGAYHVVDSEALSAQRKAEKAIGVGTERIRTPATAADCIAKAQTVSAEASTLWGNFNFADCRSRAEVEGLTRKVARLLAKAAELRFIGETVMPTMSAMTFDPEPEAAPEAPQDAPQADGEAPVAEETKAQKKARKAAAKAAGAEA